MANHGAGKGKKIPLHIPSRAAKGVKFVDKMGNQIDLYQSNIYGRDHVRILNAAGRGVDIAFGKKEHKLDVPKKHKADAAKTPIPNPKDAQFRTSLLYDPVTTQPAPQPKPVAIAPFDPLKISPISLPSVSEELGRKKNSMLDILTAGERDELLREFKALQLTSSSSTPVDMSALRRPTSASAKYDGLRGLETERVVMTTNTVASSVTWTPPRRYG